MGIANGKYDVELIKRTKKLIESYDGIFNITLLMNCILSLIVLPQQHNARIRRLGFMNNNLYDIPEIEFVLNSPNFQFDNRNYNNDLKNLLNRIRNGIAHQRIEAISQNSNWTGIIIEDYDRSGNVGLHLELTIVEIQTLAFYIADNYLNEISNIEEVNNIEPTYDF
ncbi:MULTISPECIES: HEPN family nuclease [Flavobacterium]|uniref:HEPN family nuclease n=1 Tax=Flavobacterium TaxID=237 RepID=UPI0028082B90|nr:HEPN family nuclease [Flavobacterium lindanitolerans]MDQ7961055.1 HEPN family nuclease [Flavobacterium lindanitolerans]